VTGTGQRDRLPESYPREHPAGRRTTREPAVPRGPRQPLRRWRKTGRRHRTAAGDQAAQDRSGPPG